MARKATATTNGATETDQPDTTARRRGGPRLTSQQRAEIVSALADGEKGPAIATKFNVTPATIYAIKRKNEGVPVTTASPDRADSELKKTVVSWAVRTLMGVPVPEDETSHLAATIKEAVMTKAAAGL